jgi:hypothetical protein
LEDLLRTQMDAQDQVVGEGRRQHVRVVSTRSNSGLRPRPTESSHRVEFDTTTREYRTRSTKGSSGHSSSRRDSYRKSPT